MLKFAAALAVLAVLSACGEDPSRAGGRLAVVASFYPVEFALQQVGGDHVNVRNLVKPGAEPHELDLTPRQVAAVADADLVVYLHGLQPVVDETVASEAEGKSLDVATVQPLRDGFVPIENGEDHARELGKDPHVWLDPIRYAAISDAIGKRLAKVDPAHATDYTANAASLRGRLEALDGEYRAGLAHCERHSFVVSHNAFGYLAERYHVRQQAIAGLNPDADLSPGRMTDLVRYARANKVTVIFFETLVSPKLAETLASEIGATARVLDPIEGLRPGRRSDYFSVMRSNLTALRSALGCS